MVLRAVGIKASAKQPSTVDLVAARRTGILGWHLALVLALLRLVLMKLNWALRNVRRLGEDSLQCSSTFDLSDQGLLDFRLLGLEWNNVSLACKARVLSSSTRLSRFSRSPYSSLSRHGV